MSEAEIDPWLAGKARLAETRAAGRAQAIMAREAAQAKQRAAREERAEKRRKRRRALVARWLPEVPWLVIMGAPMLLSWTAMAAFGVSIFGPVGVLLPLFADASLIVFAMARSAAVKRGEPGGALLVGVLVSAGLAGGMAFAHGVEDGVDDGGLIRGLVMAAVAVGGAVVHQLVHGRSPQAGRTRRDRPRGVERAAARRADRVRRAAVLAAVPVVRSDGAVTLVHRSGPVRVTRTRWGRTRVVPTPDPEPGDRLAEEIGVWLAAGAPDHPAPLPGPAPIPPVPDSDPDDPDSGDARTPADPAPDPDGSEVDDSEVQRVLDAHADGMRITVDEVRKLLRVRKDRASQVTRAAKDRRRRDDGGTGPVPVRT
ncbi:hypothetical protein [Actinoalloteichus hymeniacidonis]|uniref:DUF2637 family protein n=1 Tax=Actinoalloteichus hymeniacidonis TaxID=340345 RepID=A0AAC9MZ29_9PSEU|nr:hypothetical protein [Actinoalloteichus hymeniacidonis]AOS65008.1 putative DUF2637 family protein [Actinoalloteichus hymeniacidonis]MBB5906915.1 hypothetical protein [Actinoalloteichus hymeniacidonis]